MLDITTARQEIDERNRVRADAHLPLLSPAKELRRLYEGERRFEEFCRRSPLRRRVEERLLHGSGGCGAILNGGRRGSCQVGGWPFLCGLGERCSGYGGWSGDELDEGNLGH